MFACCTIDDRTKLLSDADISTDEGVAKLVTEVCEMILIVYKAIKEQRDEAIKEFAERLKNMLTACSYTVDGEREYLVRDYDIDNLVKEMVGEGK